MGEIDNGKVLMEIFGEVRATSSDVKHMKSTMEKHASTVDRLHERVDHLNKWMNGMKGAVAVVAGSVTFIVVWFKHKIFGG